MGLSKTKTIKEQIMALNFDILYNPKKFIQIRPEMYLNITDYFNQKKGFVYLASSKNNNLLKIGRTGKTPLERAQTLSTTGVLYDFEILFSLPVMNQFWCESMIHEKLKKYRIEKEFFAINQSSAVSAMEKIYNLEEHFLKRYFNIQQLKSNHYEVINCLKE